MPNKSLKFSGFQGGVYASANVFDQPRGTVPRILNLVYTRRGGLQTVDGSHPVITPAAAGPYNPFVALLRYNPPTGARMFGLTLDNQNNAVIIDVTGPTWTLPGLGNTSFPNAGPSLGGVQIGNSMAFALGINVVPQLYRSSTDVLAPISNTFQATTNIAPWLASTQYAQGARVLGGVGAVSYIFKAENQGNSGAITPTWTASRGSEVSDNSITWRNKGPAGASAPTGAAFCFNHLSALWIWGTAPTYTDDGIHGPDGLAMSDIGLAGGAQPTSFDPGNTAFIGEGDGQLPAGGAVWSQLEVGIPASPQLVLFKSASTYSVLGAFPAESIQQIPNGVGCVAPTTIIPVFGIGMMRLSYQGVAVFNGTRELVDQFTDPIRPYLFAHPDDLQDITPVDWSQIQNAFAVETVDPPGYLLMCPLVGDNGFPRRGFFFDRLLKAWSVLLFPMGLGAGILAPFPASNPQSSTLVAGWADGIIRAIWAGDEKWDSAGP